MQKEQQKIGIILTTCAFISLLALLFIYTQNRHKPKIIHQDGASQLILYASDGRHFHIQGKINNTSVEFLLDTGATLTAINENLAERAQIKTNSRTTTVSTANGNVEAQMGTIAQLEFGPFTLYNIEVFIVPNLSEQALLGMNALKHFNWRKEGNTLTLSSNQ